MIDEPQSEPLAPIEPSEEAVRLRSKQIWEREGCPEGLAEEHWSRAKAELEAEQEHWMRAKAELAAEMEKTSPAQAAPVGQQIDFLQSVFDQAVALMPKTAIPAAPPPPLVATAKRSKPASAAPSIVAADIVVQGTLESTGDIQLNGCVEGDVRSAGLVVDDKAVIQGEVIADDVTVRGCVRGSIRARKIHLCAKSRVEGDILYEIFSAEAGAQIEGHCRHADNPLALELAPEDIVELPPLVVPLSRSAA